MTTLRTTFEFQIDVNFIEKDKAEAMFIESDWKDVFYTFIDLDEVAEHLALNFHQYDEKWEKGEYWKHIEGFGSYKYNSDTKAWHLAGEGDENGEFECGDIIIKYESKTECTDVTELN
ncbi:hypothetical protein HC752_21505 [Vibrio sp. S9_S30]|uniref:hypothetical protein n=1 Tax=Vibrio sp. S9_S30 TaxID=2720226 RepID=UPI0016816FD5|nr:hypothetical protein [Vibrio sp. S9_S30]MBD1559523.1 hypothetical protein [Vibrio sp. S9_S30]